MFLLANEGVGGFQWVLLGLIVVLIILYPVFTVYRNKKEKEKFDNLSKELKIGDRILTSSGTYGEIVSINERDNAKVLTIKTGDDINFGYMAVDVLTVYSVFRDEEVEPLKEEIKEVVQEEIQEETEVLDEDGKPEVEVEITEEVASKAPAKKANTSKKAKSTKKTTKK